MSEDFRLKLELYRDGKLSAAERAFMEEEIERYSAIKDYLEEKDEQMIADLKKELDREAPTETSFSKRINRKMVAKIIRLSLITVLVCLIVLPMLYLAVMSFLGNAFRVDSNEFTADSVFSAQFMNMAFPQVRSGRAGDHTEFYKQTFTLTYTDGLSHKAQAAELAVNYSFGKLKKPEKPPEERLQTFSTDDFHALNPQTYFNPDSSEWNYLEEAPAGTKARIFVAFKSGLSPQKAFEALGKQYFQNESDNSILMLADTGSTIVMANTDPAYFYEQKNKSVSKQSELEYINKYNNGDNEIHKEVFLYGLNQIKKHSNIAGYIVENYSYGAGKVLFHNIGTMLSYVEENGVQYVGAVITGDTKELLELKNNPQVYACRVYDIVVW